MFEAYTHLARKCIFMGRYEASQFGSETIEIDHLFLGFFRADPPLAVKLFESRDAMESVRERISIALPRATPSLVSIDLPVGRPTKRVLGLATAEAERLGHKQIEPAHILLGILRDGNSLSAEQLSKSGVTVARLEQALSEEKAQTAGATVTPAPAQTGSFRNLVHEANVGKARPLVGRETELQQIIQILSRRTRNNPVLIGEPGVGKYSLVHGLANRIAEGDVPLHLIGGQVLEVDIRDLTDFKPIAIADTVILYCRGLFDHRQSLSLLAGHLKQSKLQCIAIASPLSFRLALDRNDELVRAFEPVTVLPPSDALSVEIIDQSKDELELFHGVTISREAVQTAVSASARFLPHRALPDRALDLIDDAATLVKLRAEAFPPDIEALKLRLRQLARDRRNAMAANNFELSRSLATEEDAQRIEFFRLKKQAESAPKEKAVTGNHILEALASRTSLTVGQIQTALENPLSPDLEATLVNALAARVPPGRRDWIAGLYAHLSTCSKDDAEQLVIACHRITETKKPV